MSLSFAFGSSMSCVHSLALAALSPNKTLKPTVPPPAGLPLSFGVMRCHGLQLEIKKR